MCRALDFEDMLQHHLQIICCAVLRVVLRAVLCALLQLSCMLNISMMANMLQTVGVCRQRPSFVLGTMHLDTHNYTLLVAGLSYSSTEKWQFIYNMHVVTANNVGMS